MTKSPGFDPLSDLYLAQLNKPSNLAPVNLRTLTPFHRALLAIDGTVTTFIEAYTMEPLEITPFAQVREELSEAHAWLDAPKGTLVAVRHALLRGEYSRRVYVYAVSYVVLDRLPEAIRRGVEAETGGLGRVLSECDLETRREVLWYGREQNAQVPPQIRQEVSDDFISRTYRIIFSNKPIMMINERFPWTVESLPSLY